MLMRRASALNHRQLIVLSGDQEWARELLTRHLERDNTLWLGDGEGCVAMNKASSVLGREYANLIFNAYSGFNPDAFGQSVGTLAGGGLCFIIAPAFKVWPAFDDPDHLRYLASPDQLGQTKPHFIKRMIALIEQDNDVVVIEQHKPLPCIAGGEGVAPPNEITQTKSPRPLTPPPQESQPRYRQQQAAVAQIIKTVTGHRRRPLVITADRGRGKSSALGIAAAQLLRSKLTHIIVTAPNISALKSLFAHAARELDGAVLDKHHLLWRSKTIRFVPPDELVEQLNDAQLLMIDEAAAIPTPMLTVLAKHYSRLVFATTIHGYEGTGRGFSLRFLKTLAMISPNWRSCQLEQPIRWSANDPLERLSNAMLGLSAKDVNINSPDGPEPKEHLVFKQLTQQQLANDEQLLAQVFGLLVLAHYQTKPSDFRQLLDAPSLYIFVMMLNDKVVATALILREGELDDQISEQIWQGTRRLRGHLLPQSLVAQVGLRDAAASRYARIMRIAVHPQLQARGIGALFEHQITQWAHHQGIDFVGASFGATAPLTQFWLAQGYTPLRLGLTKDRASGTHSLLVLKSLQSSKQEPTLIVDARDIFCEAMRYGLSGDFKQVNADFITTLLRGMPMLSQLSHVDSANIFSFVSTARPFEQVSYAIEKLVWHNPQALSVLDQKHRHLVIAKVLQQHSWHDVVGAIGLVGQKQAKVLLKQAVKLICDIAKQ